ncbi:hypothetical protein Spico_0053 [Parasphaerochaeta coccoides DSM 17374]|uniref:Uncharacterized protein n=1 Tax=Parasphaerochaeta coccoides (strain ATCC BAA-1237 / DSM 17374 / SPN1) TaxID=760011 RepID=F4GJ00_PARC1|nr:hypothetical protein Spico_0053 [Parasphaerochaeta coccoides DSM 17374]
MWPAQRNGLLIVRRVRRYLLMFRSENNLYGRFYVGSRTAVTQT